MQERKKYTKEFKLDAVSLVNDQGYTRIEDIDAPPKAERRATI